jgi:hypothetical protein
VLFVLISAGLGLAGPASAAELIGEPRTKAMAKVRQTIEQIVQGARHLPRVPVPLRLIKKAGVGTYAQQQKLVAFTAEARPWGEPLRVIAGIGQALEDARVFAEAGARFRVTTGEYLPVETYTCGRGPMAFHEAWIRDNGLADKLHAGDWGLTGDYRSFRFDLTSGSADTINRQQGKQLIADALGKDPATLSQWVKLTWHSAMLPEKTDRVVLPATESLIHGTAQGVFEQRLQALRHYIEGPNTQEARAAVEDFFGRINGARVIRRPKAAEVTKYAWLDLREIEGIEKVAVIAELDEGRKAWVSANTFDAGLRSGELGVYLGFHLVDQHGRTSLTHYIGGPPLALLEAEAKVAGDGRAVTVKRKVQLGADSPLDGVNQVVDTLKVSEPYVATSAEAAQ